MLAYVLALAVSLGSLIVYMAAFFFPEVHRKNDFIWSGVGLFYALVLWVCAGRITGGVLLGQVAGIALLGWSVTQTLSLRRQLAPSQQQTELPSTEEVKSTVQKQVSKFSIPGRLSQLGKRVGGSATAAKERLQQTLSKTTASTTTPTAATGEAAPTPPTTVENKPTVEIIDNRTPIPEQPKSPTANEEPPEVQESPLGAEPADNTNQPAGPDMPGASGKEPIPVEEIAPEAELAPPSEPLGLGSPQDRQNPPPPPVAMEVVPTPPSESESSEGKVAEPIRPHSPDPEIVEAAIHDAEEKHLKASPPETDQPENPSPS